MQYSLLLFLVPRVCPSSRELEPTEELSWLSWWGSCRNPSLDSERVGVSVTDFRRSRFPSFLDLISFLIFRVIQLPLLSSTTQHIHCICNTLLRPAESPNFYARHGCDSDPTNVMDSRFSVGTEQVCCALEMCFIFTSHSSLPSWWRWLVKFILIHYLLLQFLLLPPQFI